MNCLHLHLYFHSHASPAMMTLLIDSLDFYTLHWTLPRYRDDDALVDEDDGGDDGDGGDSIDTENDSVVRSVALLYPRVAVSVDLESLSWSWDLHSSPLFVSSGDLPMH